MNFICFSIPSVVHSTEASSFLLEQSSIEMGSKKENYCRITSVESISVHLLYWLLDFDSD